MGLHDGMNSKKSDIDMVDEGGVSLGEIGLPTTTTTGSPTVGGVDDNDDLTNLTWLQDRNLLKSMTSVTSGIGDKGIGDNRLMSGNGIHLLDDQFGSEDSDSDEICGGTFTSKDQIVHYIKEENENVYPDDVCSSFEDDTSMNKDDGCNNLPCSIPPVPYNPKIHVHAKPPYSFSSLIFMAIESSPSKALPVKDIYAWIVEHFPYYQSSPSGWKNTVRHNLSLNKCFKKLDKGKDELVPIVGKGSLWCVDPDLRPNLLQAVRRTPAHIYPYMSTAKTNFKITPINELTTSKSRGLKSFSSDSRKILTFDQIPQIGNSPLLGKRLLIPIINRETEETDAAQSMLTLTRYNSDESRSLNTNIKGEPSNETFDADGDDDDDDDTPIYNNPTGDHNYFNRSGESKKQNNMKLLIEAQKLINSETTTTTKLTTGSSITNPLVRVISSVSSPTMGQQTYSRKLSSNESELKEKIPTYGDKNIGQGAVLMKRKVDINDEDGLKGAQALLNLATRGLEGKMKEDKHHHQPQPKSPPSSISLPLSLPTSVKNIIDNVTNASIDINSLTMNKRRRERGRD